MKGHAATGGERGKEPAKAKPPDKPKSNPTEEPAEPAKPKKKPVLSSQKKVQLNIVTMFLKINIMLTTRVCPLPIALALYVQYVYKYMYKYMQDVKAFLSSLQYTNAILQCLH